MDEIVKEKYIKMSVENSKYGLKITLTGWPILAHVTWLGCHYKTYVNKKGQWVDISSST